MRNRQRVQPQIFETAKMKVAKKKSTSYHEVPQDEESGTALLVALLHVVEKLAEQFEEVHLYGDETSGFKKEGPTQDYSALREHHVKNGTLFCDEDFDPEDIEMPEEIEKMKEEIVWKRPSEIVDKPQFTVDGISRFDINQGSLGDCWFLAGVANLTMNKKLFSMVVPSDQSFSENYAGIFHFRFWHYGRWIDVVVDDRLPTFNDSLIFLTSNDNREFWPPLLEKAYAKLYGSYKNIEGGLFNEALEDLCGGLSETYEASHPQAYDIMLRSYQRSSFLGASFDSEEEEEREDGLIGGHAYSITGMEEVKVGDLDLKLIRLRNPWGTDAEWKGKWSDKSSAWTSLPEDLRLKLLRKKDDGEFWMEFEDFQRCYTDVEICHPNPTAFLHADGNTKTWNVNMFEGIWEPEMTAGGGLLYKETIAMNPQYHMTITGATSRTVAVIIGLLQKDRRIYQEDNVPLEINIFRVKTGLGQHLGRSFFESAEPIYRSEDTTRQLTVRVMLPAGKYCVVPSTYEPDVESEYLLRVYSEVDAKIIPTEGN